MPTELPLNLFHYSYLDFASHTRCSFAVGIPQMMLLEFENQANQNVDKIILESLSDGEKKKTDRNARNQGFIRWISSSPSSPASRQSC